MKTVKKCIRHRLVVRTCHSKSLDHLTKKSISIPVSSAQKSKATRRLKIFYVNKEKEGDHRLVWYTVYWLTGSIGGDTAGTITALWLDSNITHILTPSCFLMSSMHPLSVFYKQDILQHSAGW